MFFHKKSTSVIIREREKNAISSYGSLESKLEFLKGYRISESEHFKNLRDWTAESENPSLEAFQSLYKDLNEILGWNSLQNVTGVSDELKDMMKNIHFDTFRESMFLPRSVDNPNSFWVLLPKVSQNRSGIDFVESFKILIVNFENVVNVDYQNNEIEFTIDKDNPNYQEGTYIVNNSDAYLKTDRDDGYYANYSNHQVKNRLFGQLGGEVAYSDINGYCPYYISFLKGAFDLGCKLFVNSLDAELRRQVQLHPLTVGKNVPCIADGCKSGYIYDDNDERHDCSKCKGTGEHPPVIRLGEFITYGQDIQAGGLEREKAKNEAVTNFIQYIEPSTESFQIQLEINKELKLKLETALAQVTSKTFAQSADAQEAQWKGRKNLADRIGEQLWRNCKDILQAMQDVLLIKSPDIIFDLPDSFVDENINDLRGKVNDPTVTNPFELTVLQTRLYEKEFANNPAQLKAMKFTFNYDNLATYKTVADKIMVGTRKQVEYSTSLPTILQRLIYENPEKGTTAEEKTGFSTWNMTKIKTESDKIFESEFMSKEMPEISDGSEFNEEIEVDE
jgi:hypothetical protein